MNDRNNLQHCRVQVFVHIFGHKLTESPWVQHLASYALTGCERARRNVEIELWAWEIQSRTKAEGLAASSY